MNTHQEYDLTNANIKLYNTIFTESIQFIKEHDYRIESVDLPIRFAVQWQIPIDCNNRERERKRELLSLDPTGALLNMPADIFEHVYYQRYGDPYTKRGIDLMSEEELEELIKCDLSLKAELEILNERFAQFQSFLRHIHIMYIFNRQSEILKFDLFDFDSYDKINKHLDDLIDAHIIPGLEC